MAKSVRPPGRRATSYDVAMRAGVAQSTVSRCFQPDSNISEETRKKVLDTARALGYTPNALARSLITRRSNAVGVLITRYTLRGAPALLYSLGDALDQAGQHMILLAVDDDASVKSVLQGLVGYPLDGLIACATMDPVDVEQFVSCGVNVLFFNRQPGMVRIDSVSTDHAQAAHALALGMARAGRRRFLCVGGPAGAPVGIERIRGFERGLREAGMAAPEVLDGAFSYDTSRSVFLQAMRGRARPDAVFCANDQMAMGVLDACRHELHIDVPGEVMVAGFDDVPEGAHAPYDLTTVRQPIDALAHHAVQMLGARKTNPGSAARHIKLPGEIIMRGSAVWRT